VSLGRQAGLPFADLIAHGLMVVSSDTMARREHVVDSDIVKWLYEESDCDLDFTDEEQTKQTDSVKNDFS
jgi:hypothetical protein